MLEPEYRHCTISRSIDAPGWFHLLDLTRRRVSTQYAHRIGGQFRGDSVEPAAVRPVSDAVPQLLGEVI